MNKKLLCVIVAASIGVTACANASFFSPTLKTQLDKVSYAIGFDIGKGFKSQGINIEMDQFTAGFKDGINGKTPAMTQADMDSTLMAYQQQLMEQSMEKQKEAATTNAAASTAYLQKIAGESGVKEIQPGLYYKVITAGNGKMPGPKDVVTVNYEGSLADGTVFDSSYKRGQPVSFPLNQVIPGWTQALQKMPVGSTWIVYIAPNLAYGESAPPQIGPNQALTFKIELLSIAAPKAVKGATH